MTEQTWSRQLHPCLKSDMTMKITERWASKFPEGKTSPHSHLTVIGNAFSGMTEVNGFSSLRKTLEYDSPGINVPIPGRSV